MKRNTKSDELHWSVVTTLADGTQQTKWHGEPINFHCLPIFRSSSILYHTGTTDYHRYEREMRRMKAAQEWAVKEEERLERLRIERVRHLLELQRAILRRRMIKMILTEMASAIFQTAGMMVKKRELRMAFREFLADIQYDAIFNNTENLEE